jgi:predicted ATPase
LEMAESKVIRTPDQRLRVFVSSTLQELAAERQAVRDAVTSLRLVPVMFELSARAHPPRQVYRAYLEQSQVFVGVYWQSYGWVAPGEQVSGLEDEYRLAADLPTLIYVKAPAPEREPPLARMLARIRDEGGVSYQHFSDPGELRRLVENDLAVLLSERFEAAQSRADGAGDAQAAPLAGAVPVSPTPLVGRDRDAAAVCELVAGQGVRLVTLTGPGGVGKSRLAEEVADRLGPGFADGVRFVDLATVPAAELMAAAVATALGLNTSGAEVMTDIVAYLRPRRLLLLLDNFEQVMGAAPLVAELLSEAPSLVVLVTSRMVLRLSGEHAVEVPTLPVPDASDGSGAAKVRRYAAVRLFVERARAVAPGFRLTKGNAAAVAEICRRLEGLPLAIELAAARAKLLPPQALLSRLDDRMGLLTGGALDLPERQRTLRTTLDWSFDLLPAGLQGLFARLGVFAGTFGLAAVEAIYNDAAAADPNQAGQVMDTLGGLVDSSLVRPEARGGEPRFRMLDTVREYALARLRDGSDWQEAHDRHAAYFLALAEPAEAELDEHGQLEWLDRLETDHGNLNAALSWLADQDQFEPILRLMLMKGAWRFWWLRGRVDELARIAETIAAKSNRLPPHERGLALAAAGFHRQAMGDQVSPRTLFEQSLSLLRQTTDKIRIAYISAVLGHLSALQRDDARASELLELSQAELHQVGNDEFAGPDRVQHLVDVSLLHNFVGQTRLSQGDHNGAVQLFTEAVSAARRGSDRFALLISLYDLALANQARGDLRGAAGVLAEGCRIAAGAGDQASGAYYLEALADVARMQDDPQRAVRLLAAAGALLEANGSGWLHAWVPRAPHDDDSLAVLRSRMDAAAFDNAWARGRSIAGKRAAEIALEGS